MHREIIRLLLIEDNPGDVRLIRELLSESRVIAFDIIQADRLSAALQQLSERPFDIVLLDLGLPDSQGFNALLAVHDNAPGLPIIVLTGLADEEAAVKAVQMSAQDYLIKGQIESTLLVRSIRYAIERKQLSETLRDREENYRELVQNANSIIIKVDPRGNVTFFNEFAQKFFGYTEEEIIGKNVVGTIVPPRETTGRDLAAMVRETMQVPERYQVLENENMRKSGERVWIAWTNKIIRDKEGRFDGLLSVGQDITSLKRAQREIDRISHRNRLILERAAEGIIGLDTNGKITFANDAAARMLGYNVNEIIGKDAHYLWHHSRLDGSPYPSEECPIIRSLREGTTTTITNEVYWRKNGTSFPVEYSSTPIIEENAINGAVITFGDITERKRAEKALKESEERYRELVQNASSIIIKADTQGNITFFNEFAQSFYGYTEDEVIGNNLVHTLAPFSGAAGRDLMALLTLVTEAPERYHNSESESMTKNGERVWIAWTAKAIRAPSGTVTGILTVGQDITDRKRMEEAIWHQAYHDILTDLPNRMLFIDHLNLALTQARRHHHMLAVMFLDLDRFKSINDSLGHAIGDQLLTAVAYRLNSYLREGDTIARIGGDEYTILLPQVSHEEDVITIVQKIISAFQHPYVVDHHELHITTSIGISLYPGDGDDVDTLIKNADIAMYHAKEQGRNNYQFYNPSMNIRTMERIILENSLRQTLERKELVLYYQPQVDIATRQIVCAEALVRWNHPELGMLSPMHFIPLAEETGLIIPIDEWVLETACAQNKAWQDAGHAPLCVTVNLSAHQFQQPNLSEIISEALHKTGLDPRWLELEITESTAMQKIDITIPNLTKLTEMGVTVAIDDFGTGYSSLSYLKKLPIQKLKIDKSFISGLTVDPDYEAIVNAVIAMAHTLKMRVTAEGVETQEQLSFLHSSHCDEMQGFLFSRPLPAEDFADLATVYD